MRSNRAALGSYLLALAFALAGAQAAGGALAQRVADLNDTSILP